MTQINYSVDFYNPSPIKFTPTGHVDMDYFDDDPAAENETHMLAIFYDEEVEELCRPILNAHEAKLEEQNKEEWAYVNINRHEVKPEKVERVDYGPEFSGTRSWTWAMVFARMIMAGMTPTSMTSHTIGTRTSCLNRFRSTRTF